MKYSVVVPVYNVDKYLPECIESVINQTHNDWELILVDDGSTDESGNICDLYAQRDDRIIVIHSENKGGYHARLLANKYLTGDYVIGLDSDDKYETNCLEIIDKTLANGLVDMVEFCWCEFGEAPFERERIQRIHEKRTSSSQEEILLSVIEKKDHLLWNKAIKKEAYLTAKYLKEEYMLGVAYDYVQLIPILCNVKSACFIDEALYNYRIHNASVSHTVNEQKIIDLDWVNCQISDFLKREGYYSKNIDLAMMKTYSEAVYPRLRSIIRDNTIFFFLRSKMNRLEYMKKVYDNRDIVPLKKKEAIIYKEAIKGRIFWGIVKAHFS